MFAVRLIGVLALVALNGFFAAAEFSLVAVRLSRVRQLVQQGDARARVVDRLLGDLHRVVSAVQLGITLTSLALGALGESTFAAMIRSVLPAMADSRATLLAHAAALAIAFAMLSALHVVIGMIMFGIIIWLGMSNRLGPRHEVLVENDGPAALLAVVVEGA